MSIDPRPPRAQGVAADPEPPHSARGGLFRHHDFRQLFIGDTISQVGTQLTMLALPVLAVTLLHADEFEMGLLGTCEFLAFLVIGLPAGAWVDRWRKKRVLMGNDLIRAVALASLPLAWALDVLTLVQLFVVALVMGCARSSSTSPTRATCPTSSSRSTSARATPSCRPAVGRDDRWPGRRRWVDQVIGAP